MAVAITSVDWFEGGGSSLREEMGVSQEYRRSLLITGLSAGSGASTLTSRIDEAETYLDSNGFAYNSSPTGYTGLKLVSREFSTYREETTKLLCTVTYANRKDVLGPIGTWTPILTGSLNQIQTGKDYIGFPINVTHTFPDSDPNYPGLTLTQGGQVAQFLPLVEITYRGIIQPASIVIEKFKYLGRVNATNWNHGPRGTWLCTGFNAEVHSAAVSPAIWSVDVTFQADPNGWFQEVVFIDPGTGKPPANLIPGSGIRLVQTQPYVDFNELIPGSTA